MKFSCVKEHIERAVSIAERFTAKNITLPILGNILLETTDNSLTVTGTNLEHAVQISVPGKGQIGRLAVPGKILSALLQSLRDEKITIEERQGNLLVKTDTRDTRINGMPSDDFPLLPKIKKTATIPVDAFLLRQGLEHILPAVSTSEFKPELAGVYFHASGKSLRLTATDTFRLAEKKMELSEKIDGDKLSFILPNRVAQELTRVLSEGDEEVRLHYGDNQILIEYAGIKIISRLVEGNFPEYTAIIPQHFDTTSHIQKNELIAAVRSSSIFSSKIQEVTLQFGKKQLEINSANQDIGENKTILPAPSTGKELKVSFNYRYLLDGVNAVDEDELFFGVNENAAALIKNKADASFAYVLMPIRLT